MIVERQRAGVHELGTAGRGCSRSYGCSRDGLAQATPAPLIPPPVRKGLLTGSHVINTEPTCNDMPVTPSDDLPLRSAFRRSGQ